MSDESESKSESARIRRARSKFLSMAATYTLGVFNDNFFRQAIIVIAVALDKNSALPGYATMIFAAPFIFFASYAGWLADRYSKRQVIIASKVLELVAMLAGAAGILYLSWPLLFLMLFTMALQSTIFSPALNGSIPELYPESFVTTANGRLRTVVTAAILAGVALSGKALSMGKEFFADSSASYHATHLLVAVTIILVALLGIVLSLKVPCFAAANPQARFPWSGPIETIATLYQTRRDPILGFAILCAAFIWHLGTLQLLLITPLGLDQLGLDEAKTSYLSGIQMIGIAIGGLTAGALSHRYPWYRLIVPAGLGIALFMFGIDLADHTSAALQTVAIYALLMMVGIAGGLFMIPVESFIQIRPAAHEKGKIIAAANCASYIGISLAGPVYALFIKVLKFKPSAVFFWTGLACLISVLLLALLLKQIVRKQVDTKLSQA